MIAREKIREKLLNVSHNGTADIAGVTVENNKNIYTLMLQDGTVHSNQTMNDATRTIFNSQTK
jgi:hypothetical protein